MGIFSVDTSDKLSVLCASGLGIATCGTGALPLGLAVAGGILALPSVYKHFKSTDKKTYKSLINPPKTVIKEQLASWEKSGEFTKAQLSDFNKALDLLFGRLNLSPKTLMELGRDNSRIADELQNNASLASPGNFALEIDGKDNMDLAQANINRDLLHKILITGLEAFETTAEIEAKLQPFFQKESFNRMDVMQDGIVEINENTTALLALFKQQGGTAKANIEGVSNEALVKMAQIIDQDISDPHLAVIELTNAAHIAANIQREGHAGSNIDKFVDEVLKQVAELSNDGKYVEAKAQTSRAFLDWQERQQKEQAAGIRILQTDLELAQVVREPQAAAHTLLEIAQIEHSDAATCFDHLRQIRREWYERGRDMALLLDLQIAEKLAELIIDHATTKEQRGMALNDHAVTLRGLGERASGEEGLGYLRDAVAGYDLAFEVRQRATMPAQWATTQMNRANALLRLGERASGEDGLDYMRDAVAGYDLALEVYQRATMPAQWAMTQMNRASALSSLGERASGEEGLTYLREAVAGYELALEVRQRATMPTDWAMTQMNRAIVLRNLGQRANGEEGLGYLRDAVAGYDLALEVRQRATMPADWAMTQMNRAVALKNLGERASGEEGLGYLRDAVAGYDLALEVCQRATMPADWAMTQMNRANALGNLGVKTGGKAGVGYVEQAIAGYDAALEVFGEPGMEYYAEITRENRDIDLKILAEMKDGEA